MKRHNINLSATSVTTDMSRHKKTIKDPIADQIMKLNKEKTDKGNNLLDHEDEDNFLQYPFHKFKEN